MRLAHPLLSALRADRRGGAREARDGEVNGGFWSHA